MVCTKLICSVIYKKCPVAKWEDSVWLFVDDRDVATAITARYIPIIRHLLQHSWWSVLGGMCYWGIIKIKKSL